MANKKILIVEDESALQGAMQEFLLAEGFDVIVASDGEVALQLIKKEMPDMILLDIVLPKKDGFEVLAEIKKDEKTNKIPVILLTNLERIDDVEKAFALGASTYLVKSNYKLEEIVEKIRQSLKM